MSGYLEAAPFEQAPHGVLRSLLHRGKWILIQGAVLGALAAILLLLWRQPAYEAEARVLLASRGSQAGSGAAHAAAAQAERFLQRPAIARELMRRVRPDLTIADTRAETTISSPTSSVLTFRVRDASPARAAALAATSAGLFARHTHGAAVLAMRGKRVNGDELTTIAGGTSAGLLLGALLVGLSQVVVRRRRPAARPTAGISYMPRTTANGAVDEHGASPAAPTEMPKGESKVVETTDVQSLVRHVSALEEELDRARGRLRQGEEELEKLELQKTRTADSLAKARRELDELEAQLADQRTALVEAEQAEGRRRLEEQVLRRDSAAVRVVGRIDALLADIEELEAARAAVAGLCASVSVGLKGTTGGFEAPPEPDALAEAWDRLSTCLEADAGQRLENELLDAAARSPLGYAINDLPAHLRAAAQERRRAFFHAVEGGKPGDKPE
jgi:hypothetical protein